MSKENIQKLVGSDSLISHLILESPDFDEVLKANFNPTDADLEIRIDGVIIRNETLKSILDDWGLRIEASIKEELDYLKTDRAVEDRAEKLIEDKLDNAGEVLDNIRNQLWKLSLK